MWLLPISLLVFTTLLAIPMSRYMAWIMDGRFEPPAFLRWFERRLDSGGQNWKQYAAAMLMFSMVSVTLPVRPICDGSLTGLCQPPVLPTTRH